MIIVSWSLIAVLIVMMILTGSFFIILAYKPKLGQKIIESWKVPWVYWPEGSERLIILMIFFIFLCSSCTLCFQLYGLIQNVQP